ncbi:heme lyase NrfEFG subunit NrfF [Photobacterium chitinilyticum]|uniref:Formate-dependent nitrite reductase complex subunit n=1 Tax=Photobacterium chitinilyticum TaxID=2485123 RepID=A0A3S4TPA0_9GAMM|nr:heme lyase NrfEFG subunit NrfF [Photobacterium chitinilyticum]RWX56960.1 heme lyase NrfEFG subunit NrfF [Photobacterium chitinilyticum]
MVNSIVARNWRLLVLALFISWWGGIVPVHAQNTQVFVAADTDLIESVETFQFRFAADQKRAIALSKSLRCPQCQNQNLIESNSPVAKDLRLKVYQMVNEGKSDQEIVEYMTSRFGDFVLYKPKLEPSTYLLWWGPILLFILFGFIAYFSIRKQI